MKKISANSVVMKAVIVLCVFLSAFSAYAQNRQQDERKRKDNGKSDGVAGYVQ